MNIIHVIILAIIEGLTEFLPVSSTGHMVIASSLMGISKGAVKSHTARGMSSLRAVLEKTA